MLTELLQVIDLDIENLTDIVEHLNKMSSTKENSNNALAQEKTKLASCQSQDDIRRQSLEQLQVLRKKRQAVEEEEKQIQALIADIDKRQNSAMLSTTAASKPAEILPNRRIDSATRARIFMQEYEKKEAYHASPGINRDNKDWRSDVEPNATVRKMQDLERRKRSSFVCKNWTRKKVDPRDY